MTQQQQPTTDKTKQANVPPPVKNEGSDKSKTGQGACGTGSCASGAKQDLKKPESDESRMESEGDSPKKYGNDKQNDKKSGPPAH